MRASSGTEPRTAVVEFRCLGSIELVIDGVVTSSFRTSRIPALLAFLVIHPGMTSREVIAEALWPDRVPELARQNLRQTLLYLQRLLPPGLEKTVIADRSSIGLRPGLILSDVQTLIRRPRDSQHKSQVVEHHEQNVEAYRGPFLAGHYDDWILVARSQIARTYFMSLMYLSEAYMEIEPGRALNFAELAVSEEPLDDSARAKKITALNRLGRRSAARLEYETFSDLLEKELSMRPAPMVERALEEVSDENPSKRGQIDEADPMVNALTVLQAAGQQKDAASLGAALVPFWIQTGKAKAGIQILKNLAPPAGQGQEILVGIGTLASADGDNAQAEDAARRALDAGPRSKNTARAHLLIARIRLREVNGNAASDHALSALRIGRKIRDANLSLEASGILIYSFFVAGQMEKVVALADRIEALALKRGEWLLRQNMRVQKAYALNRLGRPAEATLIADDVLADVGKRESSQATRVLSNVFRLYEDLGRLDEAANGYARCIEDSRRYAQTFDRCVNLTYLGDLETERGNLEESIGLHTEALDLRRKLNQKLGIATSLRGLGRASLGLRDYPAARTYLKESAQLFRDEGARSGHASALLLLAKAEMNLGSSKLAFKLAVQAAAMLRSMSLGERLGIGPSGATALEDADALVQKLTV